MPLSDHEQQLLDQLEKQLRSEDPRFASTISQAPRSAAATPSAKHIVVGILIMMIGVGLAIASIFFLQNPLNLVGGVVGFSVMVFGGYWAVSGNSSTSVETAASPQSATKKSAKKQDSNLMDRLNDRWDKRRDQR